MSSFMSTTSSRHPTNIDSRSIGGADDGEVSEEEDDELRNPELESTVQLVGKVKDCTVLIVDDIMDGATSWIAAAETVVKKGGANRVFAIATHLLSTDESLQELDACECINHIVVTNTFPMTQAKMASRKLIQLNVAGLLAEAIRRNHHGESLTGIYRHYED